MGCANIMNIIAYDGDKIYTQTAFTIKCQQLNKAKNKPVIKLIGTNHYCYLLQSQVANKTYFGYTTDVKRRLRQHNGEIVGGAKRTQKWRPWKMIFYISGFLDHHCALSFEWKINHPANRSYLLSNRIKYIDKIILQYKEEKNYLLIKNVVSETMLVEKN